MGCYAAGTARVNQQARSYRYGSFMDIPKSWSNTKKIAAEFDAFRHTTKPDLDNILKAALDGISGPQGVMLDDKQVHSVKAKKVFCHPDRGPVLYISVSWE